MKRLSCKPGAERSKPRPDIILRFRPEAEGGLLEYLFSAMPDRKRTTVKDYLKHRQVMVDGVVTTQWDTPLSAGADVRVNTSREFQVFSNPRLKIVYEDDDIIVVNKGYGLLSVGTDSKRDGTAYSMLRDYVKRVDPRQKLFIVHRLDQHTSGLMMFAKTPQAKEEMQHNWNNMVLERRYVAVVEKGAPEPAEGIVRSFLAENAEHVVYVTADPAAGREAVTEYRTLAARGQYALVELQLATGRKNQIRVHMQQLGHPIAGDRKYGAETSPIRRLALHARTLRFVHPVTRRDMHFTTPVPASFRGLV
ncbi:MAG: RluA family pseudouridine synthase [Muribaculaceae bacterium]|nr:RluA family pseudouridine synthase [Muribaculaceae bacterium]